MADCRLEIVTERPEYAPDETIRGEVIVRSSEPMECRALAVTAKYRVVGSDAGKVGPGATLVKGGVLAAGEHRHPFSFRAPSGPASWQGSLVGVEHLLEARLDRPGATDAAAETHFRMLAQDADDYDDGPGDEGYPLVAPGQPEPEHGPDPEPAALAMLLALPFRLLRIKLATLFLGEPTAWLDPRRVRAGEAAGLQLQVQPRRAVTVTRAVARLQGAEIMESGLGEDSIRRVRVLHDNLVPIDLAGVLREGQLAERTVALDVPADAAPTFTARGAAVKWRVVVRVELEGWPAWTCEIPVVVRPPAAPVAPRPGT